MSGIVLVAVISGHLFCSILLMQGQGSFDSCTIIIMWNDSNENAAFSFVSLVSIFIPIVQSPLLSCVYIW